MFPEEEFLVEKSSVFTGVSEQPMTDQDAMKGARTRADNARRMKPEGDFWVGLEGGCDYIEGKMVSFAWITVLGEGRTGSARTAIFYLPGEVQKLVESGLELGVADDRVFGIENSKRKSGAVGLLTGDVVIRTSLYEQAVIMALIPFKNPDLY
jgi:inosine/xanthosine triphosphatase